eukprot:6596855-Ditylum_brightwellii.AAC.1
MGCKNYTGNQSMLFCTLNVTFKISSINFPSSTISASWNASYSGYLLGISLSIPKNNVLLTATPWVLQVNHAP